MNTANIVKKLYKEDPKAFTRFKNLEVVKAIKLPNGDVAVSDGKQNWGRLSDILIIRDGNYYRNFTWSEFRPIFSKGLILENLKKNIKISETSRRLLLAVCPASTFQGVLEESKPISVYSFLEDYILIPNSDEQNTDPKDVEIWLAFTKDCQKYMGLFSAEEGRVSEYATPFVNATDKLVDDYVQESFVSVELNIATNLAKKNTEDRLNSMLFGVASQIEGAKSSISWLKRSNSIPPRSFKALGKLEQSLNGFGEEFAKIRKELEIKPEKAK